MIAIASYFRSIWRNQRDRIDRPRFLTYIVTFACNARCIMCDSWKRATRNDLTITEIEAIFDQLPRLDGVRLSGGEPFVRKDIGEIATLVQQKLKPTVFHITSNGFLSEKIVRFCEMRPQSIPLYLLISVDGVRDKHNQVRGSSTAWDNTMATLVELAPRQKELRLNLAVNQTIVDAEGISHYHQLKEVLKPLGICNQVVFAYDLSATYSVENEVELAPSARGEFSAFGDIPQAEIESFLTTLKADLGDYSWSTRLAKKYYLRGMADRLVRNNGLLNPKCVALNSHLRLLPDGRVPTCQFNSRTIGSFREQSFTEIWNSQTAEEQRNWVRRCPGCWAECEILPNAVYSGDLLKKSLFL